ncbi:MAG: DegV family protein [Vallitaleaceae bacterium]|nr:DegV family protein [Vallitaleaceae bacterium]
MQIKILTDSCCDLPLSYVHEHKEVIALIGMPIHIDDEEYIDDLGLTLSHDFFYQKLMDGVFPKTSQINILVFFEKFKLSYEKGEALIYIGLSSGLSGTFNNAILAKEMFLEEHPDADITIINTLSASGGLGALVAHTTDLVEAGLTKEEVVSWIKTHVLKINHWFAIDDLEHLKNGGRIPAAMALVGTALKVKPILTLAHDGKIKAYASVRGRQKSMQFLYSRFAENIGRAEEKFVFICHAHCLEDALKMKEFILKEHNPRQIIVSELSATIGTHVGVGMLSVAFIGQNIREDK